MNKIKPLPGPLHPDLEIFTNPSIIEFCARGSAADTAWMLRPDPMGLAAFTPREELVCDRGASQAGRFVWASPKDAARLGLV